MIDLLQWVVIAVLFLWCMRLNSRGWDYVAAITRITNILVTTTKTPVDKIPPTEISELEKFVL